LGTQKISYYISEERRRMCERGEGRMDQGENERERGVWDKGRD
jgi:hypothetical protein